MRTTSLVLFLFAAAVPASAQEFEKAKAEFKQAVLAMHETRVATAAAAVAKSDSREAVDVLLDGYGMTANQIKQLWGEKIRWIREADANSDIEWDNGPMGSRPKPSSQNTYGKLLEAQRGGREVEEKIMHVEAVKDKIVEALATFKSDAAVKQLAAKMKNDSSWDRRAGVAEALGRIDHPDAVPSLTQQLGKDSEAGVKVACIDALKAKKAGTPEAVAAISEALKSEFWQVKYAAAVALRTIGAKDGIEPIIEALKGAEGRIKHEFNDALVALTGVDKHGDYATWRAWFDQNKDAVKGGSYQPKPEEKPGGREGGTTTFYGIPIKTKNVVFVLDCSGSMAWDSEWKEGPKEDTPTGGGAAPDDKVGKPEGKRKIDIARWQLRRCLVSLPEGTEFNLIFFSTSFTIMSEKMVKMNSSTRKMALEFVQKLVPEGGTNIFDPMEKAFTFASAGEMKDKLAKGGIDTVFLLTDGMPNQGQITDAAGILAKLKEMNKVKKLVINTIGAFSSNPPVMVQANEKEEGEKLLKQMADDHGGVFLNASNGSPSPKGAGSGKK